MKKLKFNLEELKINSFVTSLRDAESGEIKGGTQLSCPNNCLTNEFRNCGTSHTINIHCQTQMNTCGVHTIACQTPQSQCC